MPFFSEEMHVFFLGKICLNIWVTIYATYSQIAWGKCVQREKMTKQNVDNY